MRNSSTAGDSIIEMALIYTAKTNSIDIVCHMCVASAIRALPLRVGLSLVVQVLLVGTAVSPRYSVDKC